MAPSTDPRHGGAEFGGPITPFQRRFKAAGRFVVKYGILSWFCRLEHVDQHNIAATGPVILCPSHRSNIDTPLLGAGMDRDQRFMAKESIFKSPRWTWFLVTLGGFPVKRGTLDRETLKNAQEILKRGEVLVVYPEGARQEGPRIKPVFEGAVWLAGRAGVPIVPVGIGGSREVMPIGAKYVRPHKVVIVYGEPFYVNDPDNPGKRVSRSQLDVKAAELRERLQVVFDQAQIAAGTPNRAWSEDEPGINDRIEPWSDAD